MSFKLNQVNSTSVVTLDKKGCSNSYYFSSPFCKNEGNPTTIWSMLTNNCTLKYRNSGTLNSRLLNLKFNNKLGLLEQENGTLVGYTFSKRYKKVSPHRKSHNLLYNLLKEKNKPPQEMVNKRGVPFGPTWLTRTLATAGLF